MSRRILLVEDDLAIVEFVAMGLGYEVTSVTDARSALDSIRTVRPDLVILDVMLPDRSGIDVLTTFRDSGLDLPVIILSARQDVPDRVAGLEASAASSPGRS